MPRSISETGHGVNRANFDGLYELTGLIGTSYKPSNENLKRDALKAKATECGIAFEEGEAARRAFDNAVAARAEPYSGISALCTRILKSFRTSGAPAKAIASADALKKKVQGTRVTPPPTAVDGEEAAKARSVSQTSYDMVHVHFEKLVAGLAETAEYNPAEEELTVASLKARARAMKTGNTTVVTTEAALTAALIRRDLAFYAPETGLVDTAKYVKDYLGSLDPAKVPAAVEAKKFKFRNVRKLLAKAGLA
ncbi:hypothetical protein [Flaviaesturariibacter aridisoli]|uniref:Uncharacterized protein n=1 Tax=Flaviaesturariibacter aridisoli TaxID=2545761 RepID=A0A4R4E7R3_9BACT|nr:hypothetical protein [Flaviaesturariibacter aridisoli]TCZ74860.1 hypothetical protein E0486_00715 [Flaviaesturariibacter aridisoli]